MNLNRKLITTTKFVLKKLETSLYRTVLKHQRDDYFVLSQSTRLTDGRTDGRTDRRKCRSKTGRMQSHGKNKPLPEPRGLRGRRWSPLSL